MNSTIISYPVLTVKKQVRPAKHNLSCELLPVSFCEPNTCREHQDGHNAQLKCKEKIYSIIFLAKQGHMNVALLSLFHLSWSKKQRGLNPACCISKASCRHKSSQGSVLQSPIFLATFPRFF